MVKTTVILEDELYKELVKEALEKYGSTRKLSFLINQKLKSLRASKVKVEERLKVKAKRMLTTEDIERMIEEGWRGAIKWKV